MFLFFLLFLDCAFLFEILSNTFLLISFVCSHNDNLHGYRTLRNGRNIRYIFGNINMGGGPRLIFCHRGAPWLIKMFENPWSRVGIERRLYEWTLTLERRGMNKSKTNIGYMRCTEQEQEKR